MSNGGWIGVDLDGTLAHYDGWKGPQHVGDPVPEMLARVLGWLSEGRDVRIFTARVSSNGRAQRDYDAAIAYIAISDWCLKHLGQRLRITNEKDFSMMELWDDRAVQVRANQGTPVGHSTRGNK